MRDRQKQSEFRENLFQEHYSTFSYMRAFCQATLQGIENNKVKLHAHHIFAYSENQHKEWVNNSINGILLSIESHKTVHRERLTNDTLLMALQDLIAYDYAYLCREYRQFYIPDGRLLIPVWNDYLDSKNLR
jgi:hypothetical protein